MSTIFHMHNQQRSTVVERIRLYTHACARARRDNSQCYVQTNEKKEYWNVSHLCFSSTVSTSDSSRCCRRRCRLRVFLYLLFSASVTCSARDFKLQFSSTLLSFFKFWLFFFLHFSLSSYSESNWVYVVCVYLYQ